MCIEHKKNKIAELKEKLEQAEEKAELEQEEDARLNAVGAGDVTYIVATSDYVR